MKYRLGIDVGGTNTDAIIIDENNTLIASIKKSTSLNIIEGISHAIEEVLVLAKIDKNDINLAMLGTTQCTNAIVERTKLEPVITIRLASMATRAILPYCNWPKDMEELINAASYVCDGGYEYDGSIIKPINEQEIIDIVTRHKATNHVYAISCVFAPLNSEQEKEVKALILKHDPEAVVSISSEIGSLSLLERENATILNSALTSVIKKVVHGFSSTLSSLAINNAKLYLCQNDGTLMNIEYALSYPILTIASGPTNSIRGGVYLSNLKDTLIIDVGGTTSDLGIISNGFPQESMSDNEIGGVSSNFRMPDIISIAIGGGTIISVDDNGEITIGPKSVGYQLTSKALIFGGDTITLSDIAVKLGMVDFGDKTKVAHLDVAFAQKVMDLVKVKISDAIDLIRPSKEKVNLVIVGGGSVVIPQTYDNVLKVISPKYSDVANAIGASIAKVSGDFEKMVSFAKVNRDDMIEEAKQIATNNAILAGAKPDSVEIIEVEEFPIAYHPEEAVSLRIKAVGDLNTN